MDRMTVSSHSTSRLCKGRSHRYAILSPSKGLISLLDDDDVAATGLDALSSVDVRPIAAEAVAATVWMSAMLLAQYIILPSAALLPSSYVVTPAQLAHCRASTAADRLTGASSTTAEAPPDNDVLIIGCVGVE